MIEFFLFIIVMELLLITGWLSDIYYVLRPKRKEESMRDRAR